MVKNTRMNTTCLSKLFCKQLHIMKIFVLRTSNFRGTTFSGRASLVYRTRDAVETRADRQVFSLLLRVLPNLVHECSYFEFTIGLLFLDSNQDKDKCVSSPCKNNGTCKNTAGGFTCTCQNGYKGQHCDQGTVLLF